MNIRYFVNCVDRYRGWSESDRYIRRPDRNCRVYPEGKWVTLERNDGWKELELCVRDVIAKSCKDVVFDFVHDFSNCQEVAVPEVEDLL